ncbi:MAG: hypothetical protein NTY12_01900 [Candidatus Falkowbacteria bacterium]|nr:hypothetical protein [Candidatus Falkowbacteria bacterium]
MENEIIEHKEEHAQEEVKTEEAHHEHVVDEVKPAATNKLVWLKKVLTLKRIIIAVIVIVVLGLGYYFKSLVIAATVNGTVISRLELVQNLEKASGKAALDAMISERLINQEAANRKVSVTAEDIKAEFDKIEAQLKDQGTTLDAALVENKITREDLTKRITTQKQLEKMLSDKVSVSDADVEKYIKDSGTTIQKGQEATAKASIKENLRNTKLGEESKKLVDELTVKAKINYFVKY